MNPHGRRSSRYSGPDHPAGMRIRSALSGIVGGVGLRRPRGGKVARVQRRRWGAVVAVAAMAWIASAPGSAAAFGTIDSGGQHREHERLTRSALACAGDAGSEPDCFAPRSTDYLAGHDRAFGAVGAPDSDELSDPAAHCDDADFLTGGYPRSREEATAALVACVDHLRMRFAEGVDAAAGLLDDQGQLILGEVDLTSECKGRERAEDRAKCASLEGLGRVLHGAQDFYAHSNWADRADPTRPLGADNPPGLDLPGPSPVLDLRSTTAPSVPPDLTTGCFVVRDEVPGVGECAERVTHAALNKDRGLIDPATGGTTDPTTPRGRVGDNFAKAVAGARTETSRQWQDFQAELRERYGSRSGDLMVCALAHDDPVTECRHEPDPVLGIALAAGVVLAAVAAAVLLRRLLRRPASPS